MLRLQLFAVEIEISDIDDGQRLRLGLSGPSQRRRAFRTGAGKVPDIAIPVRRDLARQFGFFELTKFTLVASLQGFTGKALLSLQLKTFSFKLKSLGTRRLRTIDLLPAGRI